VRAPRRWERLLGEASTLEVSTGETGVAYYERRLEGLRTALERTRDAVSRDDPASPRIGAIDRDLADLAELRAFATTVLAATDALPDRGPWEAWIDGCEALARVALKKPAPILAVLAELRALSGSPPVDLGEVLAVLEARLVELDRPPPAKRFGRVFVSTPRDLVGRSFDVVFVPGLTERVFPARLREDPLLDDRARRALSTALLTNDERSAEERLALLVAVGAARRLAVLGYPRVEAELGRPRVPSFYALDVARAIGGTLPDVDEMQRAAAKAGDARLDWPAPRRPEDAIDELEHDLSVLRGLLDARPDDRPEGRARYLLEECAHLARALRARFSRHDRPPISSSDGLVHVSRSTLTKLSSESPRARAYSTSALQLFAACPYRFYLSAILRLSPREVPERVESIDPATRGDLFHRVAATLTHELAARGELPLSAERMPTAIARLRELFDEEKRALEAALQPVVPRVFETDAAEILSDLETLVATDLGDGSAWIPVRADVSFGVPRHEHVDTSGPLEPVSVAGGFLLRGAIDVVERSRETPGLYRVTDYKTGAASHRGALVIGGGEVLQPVLYSLALMAMRGGAIGPDDTVAEARLSYATKRGGFEERSVRIDGDATRRAEVALETIDRAITGGFLLAKPRKDACRSCDFRPVCGEHEEARTARKVARSPEDKRHLDELADLRRQP
jgi:RecB family exonuclease